MRAVYQALEVSAPAILGVQGLPVRAQRGNSGLVPDDFAITEEVEVSGATLEVDGVHGLRPPRLEIDGLLLRCTGKFPAGNHKTLVSGVLHQLAEIQQKRCLFLTQAHFELLISANFSTVRPPK